jgi:hypothetical protein
MPPDDPTSPQEGALMTAKEAAAELQISRTQLQRLVAARKLTPVNPPINPLVKSRHRRLLFLRADVERLKPPQP